MTLIHHPRMTDPMTLNIKMLPLCRDAHKYFEPPNQNKALGVMTPIHHPFQGEGDPLRTQGEVGP